MKGISATVLPLIVPGCRVIYPSPYQVVTYPLEGLNLNQNIGRMVLDLERKYFGDVYDSCYQLLDEIVETARMKVDPTENPLVTLKTIYSLLEGDFHFEYSKVPRLSQTLRPAQNGKRIKDCDTGSLIYLTIAEELGLPLKGTSTPGHYLVRWHEGECSVNWETTSGKTHSDAWYQNWLSISDESVVSGAYLRNHSKQETLATYLATVGSILLSEERYLEALSLVAKAIEIDQKSVYAFYVQGALFSWLERDQEALESYTRALELDPHDPFVRLALQ